VVDCAKAAPDDNNVAAINETTTRFLIISSSIFDDDRQPLKKDEVPVPFAGTVIVTLLLRPKQKCRPENRTALVRSWTLDLQQSCAARPFVFRA
jgi:hypothetical protein